MADQGGKDTWGNCINGCASGTWVKMQKVLNKLLFGVGSEQNKEKTTRSLPVCGTVGTKCGAQQKGQAQLMRKQQS